MPPTMADYETSTVSQQHVDQNKTRPYYGLRAHHIRDQKIDGTRTFVTLKNRWGEDLALLLDPPDVDAKKGLVRVTVNLQDHIKAVVELPKHASNGRCQIEVPRDQVTSWPHKPHYKDVSVLTNPDQTP